MLRPDICRNSPQGQGQGQGQAAEIQVLRLLRDDRAQAVHYLPDVHRAGAGRVEARRVDVDVGLADFAINIPLCLLAISLSVFPPRQRAARPNESSPYRVTATSTAVEQNVVNIVLRLRDYPSVFVRFRCESVMKFSVRAQDARLRSLARHQIPILSRIFGFLPSLHPLR